MARIGRPPKPDGAKRLQGTYRKDRDIPHVELPVTAPECPPYFKGFARVAWDSLVGQLVEAGILAKVDGAALEGLVALWARARMADEHVAKEGQIISTPFGPKKNPSVGISERAWGEFRKYCTEFGISPSARMRIKAPGKPQADPVEEDFFGPGKKPRVLEGGKK